MKNRTTAAILALFLGGFGIHRFYLGQGLLGLGYLLFCWTFIPVFIALIDFIAFLVMSDNDFNAKYNSGNAFVSSGTVNTAEELEKLYSLKERGILTDQEFQARKAKLL